MHYLVQCLSARQRMIGCRFLSVIHLLTPTNSHLTTMSTCQHSNLNSTSQQRQLHTARRWWSNASVRLHCQSQKCSIAFSHYSKLCRVLNFARLQSSAADKTLTLETKVVKKYIDGVVEEYDRLQQQLVDLMAATEGENQSMSLAKDAADVNATLVELDPIVSRVKQHRKYSIEIAELKDMISSSSGVDNEISDIAKADIVNLESEQASLESEILNMLTPAELSDMNDVILEVSAGVGGQEAMLFTKQIFDMYVNYAAYKGWKADVIEYEPTELGGLRRAMASISGHGVYMHMKFEGGVHRVQRVPKTEKSGRVHTSTMTVAILPQPSEIDVVINPRDLRIETCRASGKGGQHVNTTDSAVRIVHLPTGMVAECQAERSQIRNKETALKVLRTRIYEKELDKMQQQQTTTRRLQVGSAGRSEKIRTYNVKDDRVTDHRINNNVYGVDGVLEGGKQLEELIDKVEVEGRRERLLEVLSDSSTD